MKHYFLDDALVLLSNWREAFPDAVALPAAPSALPEDPAVFWCRCRARTPVVQALQLPARRAAQVVVLLADEPDDETVARALENGAVGCCNTHAAPEVLHQVALVVGNGGLWIGQSLLQRMVVGTTQALAGRSVRPPRVDWATLLSEREVEVARLVANGASNKEIAAQLDITERTVKAHMSAIFEKLGLRDRLQLSLCINGIRS